MEIIMPKMGDAMTEGKVVRWYKKAGEPVKKGEPVLEIETDKVNLDLEAEQDGTVGTIAAEEGAVIPVGGVLATILGPGESEAKAPEGASAKPAEKAKPVDAPKPRPVAVESPGEPQQRRTTDRKESYKHTTGEYHEAIEQRGPRRDRASVPQGNVVAMPREDGARRRSSPLARKMASEMGVSLESVQGSGPRGRIVARDVEQARSAAPAGRSAPGIPPTLPLELPSLESKTVPLSAMRRTIAKRLAESTGPIPHFYLTADYDVTLLLALRQQLNEIGGTKVTVNDFIVRAAALAVRHHPMVNASFGEEAITLHGEVHIGVAVSTAEGLITPIVRNADQKSVSDIAGEVRGLAEKAKNRKLRPEEYQGSTLTISNLGAWGIEEFTAIINPPNVAILAIGAAEPRAVVVDRQVVVRDRMKVTMSCDHRVVDGALGADYLKTLRQYIEQPLRLLL
ncbi:MAG TPA: dihydrolipoamide acetyltransferase family protein [Thermoanaerobaculia bacterium]|nr:dihydrolipoamide acetyltransferase family protein [Thermoanaerobaculia bacterium]